MRAIAPRTGAPEETIAEDQHEYLPITIARYAISAREDEPGYALLTRWTLTDEERQRVADGEDIYLMVMTFDKPLQPLQMQVGPKGHTVFKEA